jgi:uncharacterized radical SAM superfamily protein
LLVVFATSNIHYEVPELGIYGRDFPSISLTGSTCELMCKHCYGRLLNNMLHVGGPNELVALAMRLRDSGVTGVLLSGGCDRFGRVPFEKYLRVIKYLKGLGLKVFIHSGTVDDVRAKMLRDSGVDAVLIDLVVHEGSVREVIGIQDVNAYLRTYELLKDYGLTVIPHIIIGLYKGLPSNEFKAIDILYRNPPKAAVFVVFTPYPGTPYESLNPPKPEYVLEVLRYGRERLNGIPLTIGCMRPKTEEYLSVELRAIELGFNGIAFPMTQTLNYLVEKGIPFKVVHECCASIYEYVKY